MQRVHCPAVAAAHPIDAASVHNRVCVVKQTQQMVHESGAGQWTIIVKSTQPATYNSCDADFRSYGRGIGEGF